MSERRTALRQAWAEARPGLVSPLLASLTELAESEIDLAAGEADAAGEALQRALTLAGPERIRRPFQRLDAPRVLAMAERQQWLAEPRHAAGENVLAEITGELPVVLPAALPLSERELEVLQYLPTMLTAGEIAENLTISVNTVKAHMRSIYRKLGAGRRREAVVAARQLGLL